LKYQQRIKSNTSIPVLNGTLEMPATSNTGTTSTMKSIKYWQYRKLKVWFKSNKISKQLNSNKSINAFEIQ